MIRIGIDVGGTNTDAVLISPAGVQKAVKTATTKDVGDGVVEALRLLLDRSGVDPVRIDAVMIGTTHFTNAVVQRRDIAKVAAVRVGLPAAATIRPFADWPADLRSIAQGPTFLIRGGHEVDGQPIVPFDRAAMTEAAKEIADSGVSAAAISAVFSPLNAEDERQAAEILHDHAPAVAVTLSHELGRIGLLARENVTLLNAALVDLARKTTAGFVSAMQRSGIKAPLFITQNDGTVSLANEAARFPVRCFASGPTNSLRGAAYLSGLQEALVVDVGGTTSDIGCLRHGFPREANNAVEVGGVRTAFRMPDLLSIGLGGGTLVDPSDPTRIGPVSVGYRIREEALVFGGERLTLTDVAVAAGLADIGDRARTTHLDRAFVSAVIAKAQAMMSDAVDKMKSDARLTPLIAVGGGGFLVPETIAGVSEVRRVEHQDVANAVGAAIAQISGEVDQIFQNLGREQAISSALEIATQRAVRSGARPNSIAVIEQEDIPLAYLPGNSLRVRVRVVGEVATER